VGAKKENSFCPAARAQYVLKRAAKVRVLREGVELAGGGGRNVPQWNRVVAISNRIEVARVGRTDMNETTASNAVQRWTHLTEVVIGYAGKIAEKMNTQPRSRVEKAAG